ncbi:hypothetical protein Anas_10202 [Armadillidium nasatum]|uniref:Uncharacterized protein n=1 Tax=Armadillidium nasatum TaxID=96803 RepID=A0A5N5TBL7_9CRUS|nr:hypothetical protein Anas_10202 [Armadillidium nasatum]
MIEDQRQLFTKVFEKWSKLKEIFAIFKKPTLGQFIDSEISLNSVIKDDSFITEILENEEISKNNTQFYDNKNNFSVKFSIRKALFNAKNLEEELCDESVGAEIHQNHLLLNCLCHLPYEEVKNFFLVLGRNLDFNKIYQKGEELNLMERKYEWTEKEERIFSKLKGSLLKLSPLRSLSKVFLALKNVLKNLENPKMILKDSGWTSDQVQRLLGYLIELGKEKNFRDFIFIFLDDKILFEETKGQVSEAF